MLGTLLGGTALAVAGSDRKSDEYGEMGASPVPVVGTVSGPTSFRVSSFNILGYDHTARGGTKKGYADGALRMKWAVQLIKSHHVDVVGLQEFQPQQYAKWVKKASSQYDIFPGYIDTVGFLRNSIAWRKDKFRLVSTTWIKLPYFHGDVLRMPVVLLQSLQTGQQIYFMNFQNPADVRGNAQKWRLIGQRLQIALVNLLKASNGLPIVWTGDMNAKKQVFCRVTKQAGHGLGQRRLPQRQHLPGPVGHGRRLDLRLPGAVLELPPGPQQEGRPHHRPPPAAVRRAGPAGRADDPAAADPDDHSHSDRADPDGHADPEPHAVDQHAVILATARKVNDR